jgi:voltage-gated potassium channel
MHLRRLGVMLSVAAGLVVVGTAGFVLIEGWPLFDALYMTVITVTTVGFMEIHPLGTAGRSFTMALALGGIFTVFFAATEFIRAVVSGEVARSLGRQRMHRSLAELENHIIVCGFGRMGRLVCEAFSEEGLPFVIIDHQPGVVETFDMPHGLALLGDATSDETLREAGVLRARTLVTAASSDADNLFITMSARLLNEKLVIVARADDERAGTKLMRAGATRVVSPYVIGGQRMALAVLRPHATDFIELATRSEHLALQIEEVAIRTTSRYAGRSLAESRIRQDFGVIIVAIRKAGGEMRFNPPGDAVLEGGDLLITLGPRERLDRLEELAAV